MKERYWLRFQRHNPQWGSNKTKDRSHSFEMIEKYNLQICNEFQPTRMGYDNQQPLTIDLTLTAGPTIKSWTILDDDGHYTPSDHKAISWQTQKKKETQKTK